MLQKTIVTILLGTAAICAAAPTFAQSGNGAAPSTPSASGSPSRPNIVFILADDLGYGDVGPYGQKLIHTPYIDELAREGMTFTQMYAGTAVCAPSRSSLMSGQHTGHNFVRGNKEVRPEGQQPIPDSTITMAEVLKQAGYATGAFGKWGLGPAGSEGDPVRQGFDEFYGYNSQLESHRYYPTHLWDNDQKIMLDSNGQLEHNNVYAPDLIQQKTLAFIDQYAGRQPFFLYAAYTLPHAELLAPDDSIFEYYKGRFPEKPYQGNNYGKGATVGGYTSQAYPHATYAAMVTRLDLYVGQIMARLKEKGLDRNTLVIFTSDNGPHKEGGNDPQFFNSGGGFRGVKRDLYEAGMREPFIARWPGMIKAGTQNPFIGAFWDMLPTFASLAHTAAPPSIDGISMVSTLTGKGRQKIHDWLYWEFHEDGGKQAVREGRWKAVRLNADKGSDSIIELYDLQTDPSEQHNIAAQHPDKVQELSAIMQSAHVKSTLFPFGYEQ
jgi:arylsulfatase A